VCTLLHHTPWPQTLSPLLLSPFPGSEVVFQEQLKHIVKSGDVLEEFTCIRVRLYDSSHSKWRCHLAISHTSPPSYQLLCSATGAYMKASLAGALLQQTETSGGSGDWSWCQSQLWCLAAALVRSHSHKKGDAS